MTDALPREDEPMSFKDEVKKRPWIEAAYMGVFVSRRRWLWLRLKRLLGRAE